MKSVPLLVVALALFAAAPAFAQDKDDLKKFQGAWTFTVFENSGQVLPPELRDLAKWSVKEDKYTFEVADMKEEGTIKLAPAKKPAAIDLAITSGPDKGKQQVGIYRIEGDKITICFARPADKERPTEFTATEENGHILVTIQRVKKDN